MLKLSSNGSDVFPKVLKLSFEVSECEPLGVGGQASRPGGAGRHARAGPGPGRAVQLDPIKPKLKPPGTERLKLEYNGPHSIFVFKINLHHYNLGGAVLGLLSPGAGAAAGRRRATELTRRVTNAAALRHALYARFPSVGLTTLEAAKAARNDDVALAVLEAYARSLTYTAAALRERARDVLYWHYAIRGESCPLDGPGPRQGLKLVHFSAQRKRFVWDKGRISGVFRGCLVGVRAHEGVYLVPETAQVELKSGQV